MALLDHSALWMPGDAASPAPEVLRQHETDLHVDLQHFAGAHVFQAGFAASITEKAVHALEYVAQLLDTTIPFVFTGGTAAQLFLDNDAVRLSRDVDVFALGGSEQDWTEVTQRIADRFDGQVYDPIRDERDHDGLKIPVTHFKITYPSLAARPPRPDEGAVPEPPTILLDVVYLPGTVARLRTCEMPLRTWFYRPSKPITVPTPTREALIGLKLTTLGPDTIGIRRDHAGYAASMGKQLFDLARLATPDIDMAAVVAGYREAASRQIGYLPEPTCDVSACLDDALEILRVLSATETGPSRGVKWDAHVKLVAQEALQLGGYVRGGNYSKRRSRSDASRVAYLAALVRAVETGSLSEDQATTCWREQEARVATLVAAAEQDRSVLAEQRSFLQQTYAVQPGGFKVRELEANVGATAMLYWAATEHLLA